MRTQLRKWGWQVAPSLMAQRSRSFELKLRRSLGMPEHAQRHVAMHGDRVLAGPCAGMRYPLDLLESADAPVAKMSGTYEIELRDALRDAVRCLEDGPRRTFVDLGAADGYYAVGIARAVPRARVVAFDLSRSARRATARLAEVNQVDVELRAGATAAGVMNLAVETGVLLCDIEGSEVDVLTPRVGRALAHAFVIVEVHEGARPGAQAAMEMSFGSTHELTTVEIQSRDITGPGEQEMRAIDLRWLICTPFESVS
jgi:hypothetical protein